MLEPMKEISLEPHLARTMLGSLLPETAIDALIATGRLEHDGVAFTVEGVCQLSRISLAEWTRDPPAAMTPEPR